MGRRDVREALGGVKHFPVGVSAGLKVGLAGSQCVFVTD